MKKITLLAAFVTVCSFAFAQIKMTQVQHLPLSKKVKSISQLDAVNAVSKPVPVSNGIMNAKMVPFYSEDFEGVTPPALPSGWTTSSLSPDAFFTGDATDADACGYWSVGTHTTFAMTNDDACATGAPCTGGCDKSVDYLEMPSLDFTGLSGMGLMFAYIDDRTYGGNGGSVEVSTDGGSVWNNVSTLGQTAVDPWGSAIIILAGTDNESDVRIRFKYDDGGDFATGFAIDDVVVDFPPSNDIALVTDSDMVYLDLWQVPIYGKIPMSQTGTTSFAARISNLGVLAQTNVILNVDVDDGNGSVFNSSDTLPSLAVGANALFTIAPDFSPNSTGTYTITFTASSDSADANPANNTTIVSYEVTDTVFARDDDRDAEYYLNVAGYGLSGPTANGSSYEFGNWYEPINADTAISISVLFGANTVVGTTIKGKIYADDGTTLLGETDWYNIVVGDIGSWPNFPTTTIPLLVPLALGDSSNYIVTMADYSGTDTAMSIIGINDGHQYATSFIMYDAGLASTLETPFVRLNLVSPADPCVITPISATVSTTTADCGADDGTATVAISSGTPPYTYSWSTTPTQDSITATGLAAGTYTVTITDGNACQVDISNITISNIGGATVSDTIITQPSCNGDNDGAINITVVSDTGIVSYSWDCSGSTGPQVTNVSAGPCTVTITDSAGCVTNELYTVIDPAIITATTLSTPDDSSGSGTATVNPSGGTGSYTYLWDDTLSQTTQTATGLNVGTYTVEVTDANGCTGNSPFSVDVDSAGVVGLIELIDEVSFNIYPNPTNGQFVVEFNNQKKDDYLIEVRNIIGQLIYSEEIDNVAGEFTKQIDLSEYRGVYFISISNSSGTRTEKLIVY